MGTIIGVGAKKAPKTYSEKELKKAVDARIADTIKELESVTAELEAVKAENESLVTELEAVKAELEELKK